MKRKIIIVSVLAMLVAATAFAAPGDQSGNPDQMYQYCNQMMGGSSAPDQGGKTQPQGQSMSYSGNMMMGSGMMGNGMMGTGNYGNMMGKVEFQ